MHNNFQSLVLVIIILTSLLITKEAKIEAPTIEQPASFLESVAVSSLILTESCSSCYQSTTKAPEAVEVPSVNLKAKIILVSDLDNDTDFISHNISQRWPLASITKLMTAVLAIEEISKEREIVVNETAIATEGEAGNLKAGQLYKVEDLIKIMILTSSNDAAVALAEFYGQGDFIRLMNKKAANLGMTETFFRDSTGLSPLNQSTANDIRKLIKYIAKNHLEILDYSRETNFKNLQNINLFAGNPIFFGGKTGYLEEAKENLVSLFSLNNRRILIIVLGAENRFEQTQELLSYLSLVISH